MKRLPNFVRIGRIVKVIYNNVDGFESEVDGEIIGITNLGLLVASDDIGKEYDIAIKSIKAIQVI